MALISLLVGSISLANSPEGKCLEGECYGPIETYLDPIGETYFPYIRDELKEKCNIALVSSNLGSGQSAISFLASNAPVVALYGDPAELNLPETIREKSLPSLLEATKTRIQIGGELFMDSQSKEIWAIDIYKSGCEDTSCIALFIFVFANDLLGLECTPQ